MGTEDGRCRRDIRESEWVERDRGRGTETENPEGEGKERSRARRTETEAEGAMEEKRDGDGVTVTERDRRQTQGQRPVGRGADKQQRESHFFGVFQGEQEFIRLMAEGKKHSKPNAKAWK